MVENAGIMFVKAAVIFVSGVILASLFVWALMQGVIIHWSGDATQSMLYYFTAWLSGIAAFTLYIQAKMLFHYARLSK